MTLDKVSNGIYRIISGEYSGTIVLKYDDITYCVDYFYSGSHLPGSNGEIFDKGLNLSRYLIERVIIKEVEVIDIPIIIGDNQVKFEEEYIQVGCQRIHKDIVKEIYYKLFSKDIA